MTPSPRIGIIGGSGLGAALLASGAGSPQQFETPFGAPSAPLLLGEWNGVPIAFLPRHGTAHTIPPSAIPFRANIWALKAAGCKWIIASGAVGSLREEIPPRSLVIPDQVIDKTHRRVGTFFDQPGAAVHVEFAHPFCPALRQILIDAAQNLPHLPLKPAGTYVCMEGPAFSTRAESLMHRQWGGDLIGMTAMPEAKLAREAEISYALVALATDYDSWRPHQAASKQALLAEIMEHMHAATDNALKLIHAAIPLLWARRAETFDAHRALELAIWTAKDKIPPATRRQLELLWAPYL
ncbi:MAG: S-methyl-5'-thioadenosine phosphorylase [Phycisphaerae bacterium]